MKMNILLKSFALIILVVISIFCFKIFNTKTSSTTAISTKPIRVTEQQTTNRQPTQTLVRENKNRTATPKSKIKISAKQETEQSKAVVDVFAPPTWTELKAERKSRKLEVLKGDRPDLARLQDAQLTQNLQLQRPTPEVLTPEIEKNQRIIASSKILRPLVPGSRPDETVKWIERGPNNIGGRTRAIAFDPNDATGKKVWAGGVTGGLYYNLDITTSTSAWVKVDDFWSSLSITKIAFDDQDTKIMYVGTGEGFSTASNYGGAGVFKSTDAGATFTQLSATKGFKAINDMLVYQGVLYVGVEEPLSINAFPRVFAPETGIQGLYVSTNAGTNFTQTLPNVTAAPYPVASIAVTTTGKIFVGTKRDKYGEGGGAILSATATCAKATGCTWDILDESTIGRGIVPPANSGRVEIAASPSNSTVLYALVERGNQLEQILKTTDGGSTWTSLTEEPADADLQIPNTDFTRGQAFYDLAIAVNPTEANDVVIGGVDLFRSTNGGTAWSQISRWNSSISGSSSVVHADQHAIEFNNAGTNLLFGHDGGVSYASSLTSLTSLSSAISTNNKNYNVTQFYTGAIHPTANTNYYLGGTQDNGTLQLSNSGLAGAVEILGGDGAACFIDQTSPNCQIAAYVNNMYNLSVNGSSFDIPLLADQSTGQFLNTAAYDNNKHVLYTYKSTDGTNGVLYRIKDITSISSAGDVASRKSDLTITGMKTATSTMAVSPYTTASTTLFIATVPVTFPTEIVAALFKVTNADGGSGTPTISTINLPENGAISQIEFGANENEILITYFNYGLTSRVYYTTNGGTNWVDKKGNLPDMPIRAALFNPNNRKEVILGTELGIYGTSDFSVASPVWTVANNGFANVRVTQLKMRTSDHQVLAATHGRGLFTSNGFSRLGVRFDLNGGTTADSANYVQTTSIGGTPTRLTINPTKSGFSFLGWFAAATGGTAIITFDPITTDAVFYAQYGVPSGPVYNVTFDISGTTSAAPTNLTGVSEVTAAQAGTPTKADSTFVAWFTTADRIGTAVSFPFSLTANTIFYPKFTPKNYAVTFDGVVLAPLSVRRVETSPSAPTKADSTFVAWFTTVDRTIAVTFPLDIRANITWSAKYNFQITYSVSFSSEGTITNAPSNLTNAIQVTAEQAKIPVRTGYIFVAWFTDAAFTNKAIFPITLTANLTLYAKWTLPSTCAIPLAVPEIIKTSEGLSSSNTNFIEYKWYLNNVVHATTRTPFSNFTQPGVYNVSGTDANGCISPLSKKYYYSPTCAVPFARYGNATSVQGNIIDQAKIIVRWCTDVIVKDITVRVYDLNGTNVYTENFNANTGTVAIEKANLSCTQCLLHVLDSEGQLLEVSDVIVNEK